MTKKHFKKFAKIIKKLIENKIDPTILAEKIADICEEENPRFSRDKFLQACGL